MPAFCTQLCCDAGVTCYSGQPEAPLRHNGCSAALSGEEDPFHHTDSRDDEYRSVQCIRLDDIVRLHVGYWRCGTVFCLTCSTMAWTSPAM
ncbi:hypothetical protein IG631_01809 [Alternaria alternata]|nr:hypothetical protein IG631_01809 [Alternaria alternata]